MPRKGPAPKRPLVNDPVYGSQLVTQLVNKVLLDGEGEVVATWGSVMRPTAEPVVEKIEALLP
mgnify:CR=1 FL=1